MIMEWIYETISLSPEVVDDWKVYTEECHYIWIVQYIYKDIWLSHMLCSNAYLYVGYFLKASMTNAWYRRIDMKYITIDGYQWTNK